jgi:glutathione S-transferase
MTARLITIAFSHYCEKARWALDRAGVDYVEEAHLPVFHYAATRKWKTRTVPLLIDNDGKAIKDSTDIVAWADRHRPGSMIPVAGGQDELAIEDDLDNHFGPATRRWAYHFLLPDKRADRYIVEGAPKWQQRALKLSRPAAVLFLRRGLKIDAAGVERSRKKIEETMGRVDEILADGRRYLTGDRFTVADLTFASLAAPILFPAGHPVQSVPIDLLPPDGRAEVDAWRARPAGQYALRLYAQDRAPKQRAA